MEVSIGVRIRSHIELVLEVLAFYYYFKVTALKIGLKDQLVLLQTNLMIEVIKDYILFIFAYDLKRAFSSQLIPRWQILVHFLIAILAALLDGHSLGVELKTKRPVVKVYEFDLLIVIKPFLILHLFIISSKNNYHYSKESAFR